MIDPIIKKELEKCKVSLPNIDDNTYHFIVHKRDPIIQEETKEIELKQDYYYVIKLEYYILHPPDNFTLSSNWNKGINPISEYLLGTPIKFIGKMVQWDCCGYDIKNDLALDDVYSGLWLPLKGFTIIKEVWGK